MSDREKCPACGAFVRGCQKCDRRPSLAIAPSAFPRVPDTFTVSVDDIIAWAQRRETRGQFPGIDDFVTDLREGRV
jgi:hypothetical protein